MRLWWTLFFALLAASVFAHAPEPEACCPFDAANRLTNTTTPLGYSTKLAFNDRGLLQSLVEPSTATANFYYDPRGRLTNRTDSVGTTIYRYDGNHNLTNVFENGKTNSWTFDAYNRVSSYRDADGNLIQYRRDANGNVTNLIYPGNRTVSYAFDSLNRLTNVTDWANRKTTLTYDLASRLTSITRPNGTMRLMNYDSAGELTNLIEKAASSFPIAFFKLNWNNAARVQWEFAGPLPQPLSVPTRTMTYDDDNRLATFQGQSVTVDLDGNLTYGPLTNDTMAAYTYDARNRLSAIGNLQYGYDPAGNRTSITNGANVTRLIVDPNGPLSQVLMRIQGGVTNYYVYGAGLLYQITETASSTNTATYHYDSRGSTVALTDGNGIITDRIEYSLYGLITCRAGQTDTPFLFNGRYGVMTDPNGLLYMRARYYNPYLCRFLNADPAGFAGGLNLYAYANGNPVSYLDPNGLGAVGSAPVDWLRNSAPSSMWDLGSLLNIGGAPPGVPTFGQLWGEFASTWIPGYGSLSVAGSAFAAGDYGLAAIYGVKGIAEGGLFLAMPLSLELNAPEGAGVRLALPAPSQVDYSWGALNTYREGGQMTAIEHINYRHAFDSGFTGVSRFAEETSAKDIRGFVDQATRYGDVTPQGANGFKIEYNSGQTIGTGQAGEAASGVRVFIRDGQVQTAFPIAFP
jgi:RHS repeat-associated protein